MISSSNPRELSIQDKLKPETCYWGKTTEYLI